MERAGLALVGTGWVWSMFEVVKRLGPFGLFILGVADSSFLFLPFGNDLLLIALVSSSEERWVWPFYVLTAAAGSALGAFLVDLLMRKVGKEGLEYFVKKRTVEKLERKLEHHAGRAVFVATLMPPPFPFTAVVMSASALQAPRRSILWAVFFGRVVRFTIESLLALWFGRRLIGLLNSDVVEYAVYAFLAIAVVGTAISVRKWISGRKQWRGRSSKSEDDPARQAA